MSNWLTDFAGKAENLLNSIDKNASKVLETGEDEIIQISIGIDEDATDKRLIEADNFPPLSSNSSTTSSQIITIQKDVDRDLSGDSGSNSRDENSMGVPTEILEEKKISSLYGNSVQTKKGLSSSMRNERDKKMRMEELRYQEKIRDLESELMAKVRLIHEARRELEAAKSEAKDLSRSHDEYKSKAQKILLEKDKIIHSYKEGNPISSKPDEGLWNEIKQITSERDLLREEANRIAVRLKESLTETANLERRLSEERSSADNYREKCVLSLKQELEKKKEVENELEKRSEEMYYLEEDFHKEKTNFVHSLKAKEDELEEIKRRCREAEESSKQIPDHPRKNEAQQKIIRDLSASVLHKQALVETLQAEKASFVLKNECLEKDLQSNNRSKESNRRGLIHRTVTSFEDDTPKFLAESPFDTGVTRNVKRAYSSLNSFSVGIGVFLRRNPSVRVAVIAYAIFLHLWVFTILFTSVPDARKR